MPGGKGSKRNINADVKFIDGVPLDRTSSLNDYYMCVCSRKYVHKSTLIEHISKCHGINNRVICQWCNLEFKHRGNLVNHAYHLHGDKTLKLPDNKNAVTHECNACEASFKERRKLIYHIRRTHFNLWARVPHAEAKQVNQVWCEKVLNTNLVMQIQKTSLNTLVMKPLPPTAGIKVYDINKRLDLRGQYPVGPSRVDELCKICFKTYRKADLPKHMNEIHFNVAKHKCNNCNQVFKRSYKYLQHICHKRIRGIKRRFDAKGINHAPSSSIRIATVTSLKPVVVD